MSETTCHKCGTKYLGLVCPKCDCGASADLDDWNRRTLDAQRTSTSAGSDEEIAREAADEALEQIRPRWAMEISNDAASYSIALIAARAALRRSRELKP